MRLSKIILMLFLMLLAAFCAAETDKESAVRRLVTQRLGPKEKITSVVKTPYSNFYEIRVGNDILYADEQVKYLFIGHVQDVTTSFDYTQARIDEINRIKFSDLPLSSAIKIVKGDGSRMLAIFEDPNCGYCKLLESSLQEINNVTVYIFLYSILSEDSITKSIDIWCSKDRVRAWSDWMLNGKITVSNRSCNVPYEKIIDFGKRWKVIGTPTIFFADGSRISNAVDAKSLEAKLSTIK